MKLCIESDGGSRGNPGIAGSGTVIYDGARQKILKEMAYVVGKATNNVAEYHSVINGLRAAKEMGATEVEVYMDSKLVVEQMSGRWKIKHPDMAALAKEAQGLVREIGQVSFQWIPRKDNARADALANMAMDALADGAKPGFLGEAAEGVAGDATGESAEESAGESAEESAESVRSPSHWAGHKDEPLRLFLIRHGETEFSTQLRYSGWGDPELTERGRTQAQRSAIRLKELLDGREVAAIMSSPLSRAKETAQIIQEKLGDAELQEAEALKELNFGTWEGLTFAQARTQDPQLHEQWVENPADSAPPEGESIRELYQRVRSWRNGLNRHYSGKTLVVVSHVNVIKAVVCQALGIGPGAVNRFFLDPAGISEIEFYPPSTRACVRRVNETGHLKGV